MQLVIPCLLQIIALRLTLVKRKFGKTSKSLKILWPWWRSELFSPPFTMPNWKVAWKKYRFGCCFKPAAWVKKVKMTLWTVLLSLIKNFTFFMDGIQLSQDCRATMRRLFTFLPLSSGVFGTHLIEIGKMKRWVNLGAPQWLLNREHWIGNPAP